MEPHAEAAQMCQPLLTDEAVGARTKPDESGTAMDPILDCRYRKLHLCVDFRTLYNILFTVPKPVSAESMHTEKDGSRWRLDLHTMFSEGALGWGCLLVWGEDSSLHFYRRRRITYMQRVWNDLSVLRSVRRLRPLSPYVCRALGAQCA